MSHNWPVVLSKGDMVEDKVWETRTTVNDANSADVAPSADCEPQNGKCLSWRRFSLIWRSSGMTASPTSETRVQPNLDT